MRYAILALSVVALLVGCASSQQAHLEPLANPVVVTEPVPVLPSVPVASTAPAPLTAASTGSVDPTYYTAHDLDAHPRPLDEVLPNYPAEADRQGVSGKVRLQLKLETDGRVSDIEVLSATPPGVFDESALQTFRDARFSPAQKNGRLVPALVLIEVVYDWEGRQ